MIKWIQKYILSDNLPIEGRLYNVITIIGAVGSFLAAIMNFFNSTTVTGACFILLLSITLVGLIVYANKTADYKNASFIICIVICCLLYPFIYFFSGGIMSGMTSWFILAIFVAFTLLKGKKLVICVLLSFMTQISCVVVEYIYPSKVTTYIPYSNSMYVDKLYSYMIVAIVIGLTIRLQLNVYEKEKQRAEDASKAKEEFLTNMSHEMRTPINAILGMNEMTLREARQEEIIENAERIERASNNLLSIITDAIDFSKIEAGQVTIFPVRYRVSTIVDDLYNLVAKQLKEKGLRFNIDVDENIPSVLWGDEHRICQIVTNILNNAVKYTQIGSVTLSVSYKKGYQDGDLIISVKDTGCGIKEGNINHVFDTFQRIDIKKNQSIEGTGLGLSIAKRLVNLMGGDIEVESVYGQGSTFRVLIPQKIMESDPIGEYQIFAKANKNQNKKAENTFIAPDAKVLIVDDNGINLMILEKLLQRTHIKVDAVEGGREAIDLVRTKKYDLIMLDYMMPDIDGIETLHLMRNENLIGDTPVVCVTANAIAGAREMYLQNGFQDYIAKPVSGVILERCLLAWLPKNLVKDKETLSEEK